MALGCGQLLLYFCSLLHQALSFPFPSLEPRDIRTSNDCYRRCIHFRQHRQTRPNQASELSIALQPFSDRTSRILPSHTTTATCSLASSSLAHQAWHTVPKNLHHHGPPHNHYQFWRPETPGDRSFLYPWTLRHAISHNKISLEELACRTGLEQDAVSILIL